MITVIALGRKVSVRLRAQGGVEVKAEARVKVRVVVVVMVLGVKACESEAAYLGPRPAPPRRL